MSSIEQVLKERGSNYGPFYDNGVVSQKLKRAIHKLVKKYVCPLEEDQQEALDMICFKISRVITGNPNYVDNWIDIAGYAKLVADRLTADAHHTPVDPMHPSPCDGKSHGTSETTQLSGQSLFRGQAPWSVEPEPAPRQEKGSTRLPSATEMKPPQWENPPRKQPVPTLVG